MKHPPPYSQNYWGHLRTPGRDRRDAVVYNTTITAAVTSWLDETTPELVSLRTVARDVPAVANLVGYGRDFYADTVQALDSVVYALEQHPDYELLAINDRPMYVGGEYAWSVWERVDGDVGARITETPTPVGASV